MSRIRLNWIGGAVLHPHRYALRAWDLATANLPQSSSKLRRDAVEFWSGSNHSTDVRHLSHWCEGLGAESWDELGRRNLAEFEKCRLLAQHSRPLRSMVEWGPGGGANAVAFKRAMENLSFYGVDISLANLEECQKQVHERGQNRFFAVHIGPDNPESALTQITAPVDFFLSNEVYQHFPSKAYGVRITNIAFNVLGSEGLALIQIRYDDGSPVYKPKRRDYAKYAKVFTSYRIEEFWTICVDTGFIPLAVALRPRNRYAYFYLRKQ